MSAATETLKGDALRRKIERDNEDLVRRFNQAWSNKDVDGIVALVADDVKYMVHEGGRTVDGKAELITVLTDFMKLWDRIHFEVLKIHVIGPLVVHERTEDYYGKDGHPDWHFWIAAMLVIQDGKIRIWRDYSMPGKQQVWAHPAGRPAS